MTTTSHVSPAIGRTVAALDKAASTLRLSEPLEWQTDQRDPVNVALVESHLAIGEALLAIAYAIEQTQT